MILVTGATGTIGREVVRALAARKARFRVLVRKQSDVEKLRLVGVESVLGDLGQRESLQAALINIESVFLLSPTSPAQIALECNLVQEAKRGGVRHIVKLSVLGANTFSSCTLLKWHAQIEQMIEVSGLEYTFLRPNTLMQNIVPFYAQSIAHESIFYVPGGEARMSFVDARDIAASAAVVLVEKGHEGRIYDLTGPEALSYSAIAAKLSQLLGRTITYTPVSDAAARQSMIAVGFPEWFTHTLVTLYHFYHQGGGSLVAGTVELLNGHKPRTIDAYLRENEQAFQVYNR